jgi:hypothetical protein
MNKVLIILGIAIILFSCSKVSLNVDDYMKKNLDKNSEKGTAVAKINEKPLSLQEVREDMKFNLGFDYPEGEVDKMMSDPKMQNAYSDKIINQHLIIDKMVNDKTFQSDDFQNYLWVSMKEAAVKYYLYKNFFKLPENLKWKEILITKDSEVLSFYEENKKYFEDKKIQKDDALSAIRNDIGRRKNQAFLEELSNFQNKLIQELKVKTKVEKVNY